MWHPDEQLLHNRMNKSLSYLEVMLDLGWIHASVALTMMVWFLSDLFRGRCHLLLHRAAFIAGVRVIRNDLFWTHRSAFVELPPTDSHSRSQSTQRRPDSCSTSKLYNSWENCCGQFWEVVFIAPDGIFWGSWDTWGMRINYTCHAFWVLFAAFLSTPSIVIWIYLLFG